MCVLPFLSCLASPSDRLISVLLQAKNALEHLNGFHLQERYIVVLYHMPAKQDAAAAKAELARREEELAQLKKKHDIKDEDH
jgi:pre-mRNA branch site protein p14